MNALLKMARPSPPPPPPPPPLPPLPQPHTTHYWQPFEKRGFCIWCKRHRGTLNTRRQPLAEIGNHCLNRANTVPMASSRPPQAVAAEAVTAQGVPTQSDSAQAVSAPIGRNSKVYGGCRICSAYLCVKGPCFSLYHSHKSCR